MFLFKRKLKNVSSNSDKIVKKDILSLPNRKTVQFEIYKITITELETMLKNDLRNTLTHAFPPSNYYQNKKSWLNCELFYNDDYTINYTCLALLLNDRIVGNTDFYKLDYKLLRDLLRRFGQYI